MLRKAAIVYEKRGAYNKALTELELAANEIGDCERAELGSITVMKAGVVARLGDYTEAIALAKEGVEILTKFEERTVGREVVRALNIIGVCCRLRGEYHTALEHHQKARALSEKLGFISGLSASLAGIGSVYYNMGNSENAQKYYLEDLELTLKEGDQWGLGIAYMNLGNAYLQSKDWPKVLEQYCKSLAIRRRIGDMTGIAMTLNNMGFVHFQNDEWDLALEKYVEAMTLHETNGDMGGLVSTLNNIGEAYWKKGENTKALGYLEKALSMAKETEQKRMVAISLLTIGQVLADSGEFSDATVRFTEARTIFTEIGLEHRAEECAIALRALDKPVN